jgi:hypothetical protein
MVKRSRSACHFGTHHQATAMTKMSSAIPTYIAAVESQGGKPPADAEVGKST